MFKMCLPYLLGTKENDYTVQKKVSLSLGLHYSFLSACRIYLMEGSGFCIVLLKQELYLLLLFFSLLYVFSFVCILPFTSLCQQLAVLLGTINSFRSTFRNSYLDLEIMITSQKIATFYFRNQQYLRTDIKKKKKSYFASAISL